MKILIILSAFMVLTFSSCSKKNKETSTEKNSSVATTDSLNLFKIDSVKVQDSAKILNNLTVSFNDKVLVFPNIRNKTLLDSIYAQKNIALQDYSAKELQNALNLQKETFFKETTENTKDFKPEFTQKWEQNSDMKLFSTLNNYMTLQYSSNGFSGGAHGYYNEIYKVFDTGKKTTLQLKDLIKNPTDKIWTKILMNNFLNGDLEKGQAQMLLVKEIPLNDNFYFDQKNLYFLYNQYEITAYAAGTVLIKIPFAEISPLLTAEFKTALKL